MPWTLELWCLKEKEKEKERVNLAKVKEKDSKEKGKETKEENKEKENSTTTIKERVNSRSLQMCVGIVVRVDITKRIVGRRMVKAAKVVKVAIVKEGQNMARVSTQSRFKIIPNPKLSRVTWSLPWWSAKKMLVVRPIRPSHQVVPDLREDHRYQWQKQCPQDRKFHATFQMWAWARWCVV